MLQLKVFILGLLAAAITAVNAATSGLGPQYSITMGSPFKTFIRKVSLSLKVPATPSPQKNSVLIYPALIALHWYHQPTLASYGTPSTFQCNAPAGQWCAYASLFDYNQSKTTKGSIVVVKPGDVLQYNIELISGGGYLETISRAGQVISQVSGGLETAVIFSLLSECQTNGASLPTYTYSNITISLALQYPDYAREADIGQDRVTTTPLYTSDGGFTWKIDTANVQAAVCTV